MQVRLVSKEDASDIFEWRNDQTTRSMSRSQEEISFQDHLVWFDKMLKDPERIAFLGHDSIGRVGMARFDCQKRGVWEVNIVVNPARRGQGKAIQLLQLCLRRLKKQASVDKVIAVIRRDNKASITLFSKAGFVLAYEDLSYCTMSLLNSRD